MRNHFRRNRGYYLYVVTVIVGFAVVGAALGQRDWSADPVWLQFVSGVASGAITMAAVNFLARRFRFYN